MYTVVNCVMIRVFFIIITRFQLHIDLQLAHLTKLDKDPQDMIFSYPFNSNYVKPWQYVSLCQLLFFSPIDLSCSEDTRKSDSMHAPLNLRETMISKKDVNDKDINNNR